MAASRASSGTCARRAARETAPTMASSSGPFGKPRFSSEWTAAPASSSRANSASSSAPHTAALIGPVSGRRNPFSSTMRMTPSAARLSANGSLLPVGFSSIAQKPPSVSSLSASATAIETGEVGTRSLGPCGL